MASTGFGDSSLDFVLRVWAMNQMRTLQILKSDLYFSIFSALKQEGIEPQYHSATCTFAPSKFPSHSRASQHE